MYRVIAFAMIQHGLISGHSDVGAETLQAKNDQVEFGAGEVR